MQLKVEFENHPSFTSPEDRAELELKLWTALAEANVLVGPGWFFAAEDEVQKEAEGHLRIAFSGNTVSTLIISLGVQLLTAHTISSTT